MHKSISMLTISMPFGDRVETVHPVLLRDGTSGILVDCGFIGSLSLIEAELERHHVQAAGITGIVLTHQDHDHVGAAAAFKEKYPAAKIYASEQEAPYISGKQKSLRLVQAEELQASLPPDQQKFGKAFCAMLKSVRPVPVDAVLRDGDELGWCGGCRVVVTPGHTPGHIALYLKQAKTLIAGDAIALEHGKPVLANPQFTLDTEAAVASMAHLMDLDAATVLCYHGGRSQHFEVIK